jgi:hypothetical protein
MYQSSNRRRDACRRAGRRRVRGAERGLGAPPIFVGARAQCVPDSTIEGFGKYAAQHQTRIMLCYEEFGAMSSHALGKTPNNETQNATLLVGFDGVRCPAPLPSPVPAVESPPCMSNTAACAVHGVQGIHRRTKAAPRGTPC